MELSWNDSRCVTLTDNNTIFRYIEKGYIAQFRDLFESGLIGRLVEEGLLQPGKLVETNIENYPLVVEHPLISPISFPFEWPALALKDVGLAILRIEEIANGYGYSLYDPHPFNATIRNGRPLYLDYGSFLPISEYPIWHGYEKAYRDSVLLPLHMYQKELHYITRMILREIVGNPLDAKTVKLADTRFRRSLLDRLALVIINRREITTDNPIQKLVIACINKVLDNRFLRNILEGANYKMRPATSDNNIPGAMNAGDVRQLKALGSRAKFLRRLRRQVEHIEASSGSRHWADYYKNILGNKPPWERPTDSWTTKEKSFYEIIHQLNPETALDIGANTGWFSLMLAHNGASVISFDRDEESINQLYSYTCKEGVDILPLIMDIRQPTPTYELNIGTVTAATERYRCEFAMALGIIHHMVHNQGVNPEHLANMLSMFTWKYLLIEFVPSNDAWAYLPNFSEENWSIDVLKKAFARQFNYERSWDSYPQGRILLLFRKISNE